MTGFVRITQRVRDTAKFQSTYQQQQQQQWVTDLAGADLSVDVCLLSDAVLQVRDMGLEPVPVADDCSSLHGVAALRPLPSKGGGGSQRGCEYEILDGAWWFIHYRAATISQLVRKMFSAHRWLYLLKW